MSLLFCMCSECVFSSGWVPWLCTWVLKVWAATWLPSWGLPTGSMLTPESWLVGILCACDVDSCVCALSLCGVSISACSYPKHKSMEYHSVCPWSIVLFFLSTYYVSAVRCCSSDGAQYRLPLYPVASTAGKELHSLAEEVVEILKGLAGREAFARVFAAVQKEVAEVRESRKRKKALDVCTNMWMELCVLLFQLCVCCTYRLWSTLKWVHGRRSRETCKRESNESESTESIKQFQSNAFTLF